MQILIAGALKFNYSVEVTVNTSLFGILNLNILAGFGLVLERQRWLRVLSATRNKSVLTSASLEQLVDSVQLAKNLIFARESALNISA